jgi:transcriptional regulator with XRE-family HTH domain
MSIKTARAQAGLTQARAAKIIGVPTRTLQDWEDGKRNPRKGAAYWEAVFHAMGYLTSEGRAAVEAGEVDFDELMAMGKREDVRRSSRVGVFGETFRAAWDKIPAEAVERLSVETLSALVDVIAMVENK